MSRRAGSDSDFTHGFGDIIGVVLLAVALLLVVAQLSFDRYDLGFIRNPPNQPISNWGGTIGAHVAYGLFFAFGFAAYAIPVLLGLFGLAFLFDLLSYLKRRWFWALLLLVALMGLLHLMDQWWLLGRLRTHMAAESVGGMVGRVMYDYFFWMLGSVGATIVYGTLYLIEPAVPDEFPTGRMAHGLVGAAKGTDGGAGRG